ncbi:hypothetical protein ABGN05_20565 [Aquibium sp. LZ166]|uniref:Uncharacterized protein n=1 Tax=Aquibium pacificus TaxID=3153579 RepID=A0ABV3SMQ1_9HYPH
MTRTIDTIGRAARHDMLIRIECGHCRHVGHHRAHEVAKVVGMGRSIESIRFVCSRCKTPARKAVPIEFDRDRPPKVIVWVPMELKR